MEIRVGYELIYDCPQPTPMMLVLHIHYSRTSDIIIPDHITTTPSLPLSAYRDGFGNWCTRLVASAGRLRIASAALVRDSGEPDIVAPFAQLHSIQELPDESLVFLLGSRYCDTEKLSEAAWSLFGNAPTGWGRVQAICDFVHNHISFGYEHARATRTAWDRDDVRTQYPRQLQGLDPQVSACDWKDIRGDAPPVVAAVPVPHLERTLKAASDNGADLAIIDTAGRTNDAANAAAKVADLILIPLQPSLIDLKTFHLKGGRKVALFIGRERACGLNCRDVPAMVVTRCGPAGAVLSWPPMNRALTTRQRRNDLAELFPDIEWEHPRPRRHGVPLFRWIGQHDWPAQAVLWLFVVTGVYLLSVFGLALGVALGVAFEVWLA